MKGREKEHRKTVREVGGSGTKEVRKRGEDMDSQTASTRSDQKDFLRITGGARVADSLCRACWPRPLLLRPHPILPTRRPAGSP